jgi:hypothetical protein
MTIHMSGPEAQNALINGTAPEGMYVDDYVYLQNVGVPLIRFPSECYIIDLAFMDVKSKVSWPTHLVCNKLSIWRSPNITSLPSNLTLRELKIGSNTNVRYNNNVHSPITVIPDDVIVTGELTVSDCPYLIKLPSSIHVIQLDIQDCPQIKTLPEDTSVSGQVVIRNCPNLEKLPENLEALSLEITDCPNLQTLPHGIKARYVTLARCARLEKWDDPGIFSLRQLDARQCRNLTQLPPNLSQIDQLDVSGCSQLTSLPPQLSVTEWIDIGGTQIRSLPQSREPYVLRWNGVRIPGRIIFHPETISAAMIFQEKNLEVRRIMLEQMGIDRFIAEANPIIRDQDKDPGGDRRLLYVNMPDDEEDLVVLQVQDPSTGRNYLIRVPPKMQTCHQAAAWIAGFDDPDQYHPIAET